LEKQCITRFYNRNNLAMLKTHTRTHTHIHTHAHARTYGTNNFLSCFSMFYLPRFKIIWKNLEVYGIMREYGDIYTKTYITESISPRNIRFPFGMGHSKPQNLETLEAWKSFKDSKLCAIFCNSKLSNFDAEMLVLRDNCTWKGYSWIKKRLSKFFINEMKKLVHFLKKCIAMNLCCKYAFLSVKIIEETDENNDLLS